MSDENKTPEMMLQIYPKDRQRRDNYRRAEAFLLWKLGSHGYDDARRFLLGSGMDWPSLFVEFVEKVEDDLLARMRDYEDAAWKSIMANTICNSTPQYIHLSEVGEVTEEMAKVMANAPANPTLKFDHWSTENSTEKGGGIVAQLEAKQKAYEDACSAGDLETMRRLAPKGPTYGQVVRPRTKAEEQCMIDLVNKAREENNAGK